MAAIKSLAFFCCSAVRGFFSQGGGALIWKSILFRSASSFPVRIHRIQTAFRKRDGDFRRTAKRSIPSVRLMPSSARHCDAANSKRRAVTQ